MRSPRPLRPAVYLVRNGPKTLPLGGVIVLAVMLVAGIVSLINSIPLSIRTIYRYSRFYIGATPRGDAEMTPVIREILEKESPVKLDRIMTVRGSEIDVNSIVGKWPFVVLALTDSDAHYYMDRMGAHDLVGRYPRDGEPEVVLSEPVARNLNKKIGSQLMGPEDSDAYSPKSVKVVGIIQCKEWVAVMSRSYHEANHFPPVDSLLAFAGNPADQLKLDHWALNRFKGERARIFAYQKLEEQANTMFTILYQILNVVIGMLVIVITIMMGMLFNIFLGQRLQEFGLLQALGYARPVILRRVVAETALVVLGGWMLGLATAVGMLTIVKHQLMDPKAFSLDVFDRSAYIYTVPIPFAIFAVAVATVLFKFRRYDPVGIVERRLV